METEKIKAILFDLGNVLVRFDLAIMAKGYSKYARIPDERIAEFVMSSRLGEWYMRGKLTSSEFYRKTAAFFKMKKISYDEFYAVWNSIFSPYREMEDIVRNLKKKYPHIPLIIVSDTNEEHFNFVRKEYEFIDLVDHFVLSQDIGRLKPHHDMYNAAITLAGVLPREIFYTDDREDLIRKARAMGLRAYQFTGHEALIKQFEKLGVSL
ncbi:MAG TPA: HAD family phosphatase [Candidatus Omnitrophota bacterium]|nr:HAD family phosphatase [Candidatus Omnitrophota bacterium]HPS19905.1 HAD family phosphatase [Candidatus Omnitrophota bacterium]